MIDVVFSNFTTYHGPLGEWSKRAQNMSLIFFFVPFSAIGEGFTKKKIDWKNKWFCQSTTIYDASSLGLERKNNVPLLPHLSTPGHPYIHKQRPFQIHAACHYTQQNPTVFLTMP